MKPFRIVVACVTLFAAFCISGGEPLFAGEARAKTVRQGPRADVLSGRVLDSAGVPIVGALVEATSLATDVVLSARTDAHGRYRIVFRYGVGDYLLAARHIGMAPGQRMLRRTGDNDCLGADILLAPIPLKLTKGITS